MNRTALPAPILSALLAALAAAPFGTAAPAPEPDGAGPSIAFELRPERDAYWAGERATALVTLRPGELDVLSDPDLAAFPEGSPGVSLGAFEPAAAPVGALRWTQRVRFDAPGRVAAEPRLSAEFGRVERRGVMTIAQSAGRRTLAAPGRLFVVNPLPENGRPADFSGLVGAFSLAGALDAAACAPGDIVNLRWELRGDGADELAEPPSVAPGRGFKVYPPHVEARERGRLAVSQALVPVSTNAAAVAAVSLSVFDPAAGAYRALSAGPFPLRVSARPPAPPEPAPAAAGPPAESEAAPAVPVPARFAPGASARELFVLGEGERVRVRELAPDGAWLRVLRLSDGATGWIPAR